MKLARPIATLAALAVCAGAALAQDEPAAADDQLAPSPAPEATGPPEDSFYWSLKGGGEVVGRLIKETSTHAYIDIGPSIITVPLESIAARESLAEALELGDESLMAKGSGVLDPAGLGMDGVRDESGRLLSQAEIVENAKKSVVVILNPRGGAGSGFIMDREGRIITNHHVITGEQFHTVHVFRKNDDGQWERVKFENAEVEAYSSYYDIAIVKVDPKVAEEKGVELVPLPIAAAGSLAAGDPVYALGNPGLGMRLMEHTVSEGIVSSTSRNFEDILYVQTTAAINPGNSGGPLINDRGEVVGLVTLGALFQEGLGFALVPELIHHFIANSRSYAYTDQSQNQGFRYLSPDAQQ